MTRTEPFSPPEGQPDIEWALMVWDEWARDCGPELDGAPAEQMKVAMGIIRSYQWAEESRG